MHCSVVLFLGISPARAQAALDLLQQHKQIEERQHQHGRELKEHYRKRQAPSGAKLDLARPDPVDQESERCLKVRDVKITGMTIFHKSRFTKDIQSALGSCVAINTVNKMLRVITNSYITAGYITSRAFVQPQDMKDDVLEVLVIEGKQSGFKIDGPRLKKRTLAMTFPKNKDGKLNIRNLEQGIDQLNRMRSYNTKLDIIPGKDLGQSIVSISNKSDLDLAYGSITVNNDGQAATGRLLYTASVNVDSPLRLGDFWSFYVSGSFGESSTNSNLSYGGYFSLPYGYWTISIYGGVSRYDSLIKGAVLSFESKGRSWNIGGEIGRLLFRNDRSKLSLAFHARVNNNDSIINDINLLSGTYRLVRVGAELRYQYLWKRGLLALSSRVDRGISSLGSREADLGPYGPHLGYWRLSQTASWTMPFVLEGKAMQLNILANGQWAFQPVYSPERFFIGSRGTVRGFSSGGIGGDRGGMIRAEVSTNVYKLGRLVSRLKGHVIKAYAGYDIGAIVTRSRNPFERGSLQAIAAGIKIIGPWVTLDCLIARGVKSPWFIPKHETQASLMARLIL